MREPPQPGDRIVVLYREGESKYGLDAALARVIPSTDAVGGRDQQYVWFRGSDAGTALWRRLDQEGVEWARFDGDPDEWRRNRGWCAVVDTLLAARRLAGTDE